MIDFKTVTNEKTKKTFLEVPLEGHLLLDFPLFNKGSCFSEEERRELGLVGLLPAHVSTVDEQLKRVRENYLQKETDLERYIFLTSLQDRNETLFYRLVHDHITEMMPIIYTPVVGAACQHYSHIFRRPRGLFIPYAQRQEMETILKNTVHPNIEVIVVTDGERILGLGDQGVGGMGIPIGKLSLYTLCAGIHPATTLPVLLDVGTDNQGLLKDPLYLGCQHERVRGKDYDDFIEVFVQGIRRLYPHALLQWEDFSKDNAWRLLERYRNKLCTFNDDIQGTGAVTLAGLLTAMEVTRAKLREQRIVILGAGSAAMGISDQIVAAMMSEGLSEKEARSTIWLVDSQGLVHSGRKNLEQQKQRYAHPLYDIGHWSLSKPDRLTLEDVVKNVHPSVLIGTGAQPGAFTEVIVRDMAGYVERPIIFPLSNPTSKSEAQPADLIAWTNGKALIATGSPFPPVCYEGRTFSIGQCNNAFIFPGVGLGSITARARRVTDGMFLAAAYALHEFSPALKDPTASLYPALEEIREVSRRVAVAVGTQAQREGVAEETSPGELERQVLEQMWTPKYVKMKRKRE